jgi:uncharacterized C2H2 Zn-finger protein
VAHIRAHEAVVTNEFWYGDGPAALGKSFTSAKTAERQADVIGILQRAAKSAETAGDRKLSRSLWELADKLHGCRRRHRCGSLACPKCARAFQKAKTAAEQTVISDLQKNRSKKHLVFVAIIPKGMTYPPGSFSRIDIVKANRWLKDTLKPVGKRPILGSVDFGWESRRGGNYLQLHWHLAFWTSNPDNLEEKLKSLFQRAKKYERHIDVEVARDHGFLPYLNKVIKLPELLRRSRTHLPELFLALDHIEPLDLMVLMGLKLSAQSGGLVLRPLPRKKP